MLKFNPIRGLLFKTDLLSFTQKEKVHIMKFYDVNKVKMKEYTELVKTWGSKQPQLPKDLSDDFIEKLLMKNKFNVEKTKEKLENYYTLRELNRDLLEGYENLIPSQQSPIYLLMPKTTPTFERIVIIKAVNTNSYDLSESLKFALGITELTLHFDGSIALRFLVDFDGFNLRQSTTWNPILIFRYLSLAEKAYSVRIAGLEFINCAVVANRIFFILKTILRRKIYNRIQLHKDLESLHKVIPKECLPVDYGGSAASISDLLEKWDKKYKKHSIFLAKCLNNLADHQKEAEIEDGGTFQSLSLD